MTSTALAALSRLGLFAYAFWQMLEAIGVARVTDDWDKATFWLVLAGFMSQEATSLAHRARAEHFPARRSDR